MRDRLILLPGWGLGVSPLEPLAAALRGLDEHLRVEIEPLPVLASTTLQDWLDELDATLPDNVWLGGWSLGAMLATELAARRGDRCCGLVTLASNPSFVSRDDWPSGMPASTFEPFLSGFREAPNTTLTLLSVVQPGLGRASCIGQPAVEWRTQSATGHPACRPGVTGQA